MRNVKNNVNVLRYTFVCGGKPFTQFLIKQLRRKI
jgi:hypothetical protein